VPDSFVVVDLLQISNILKETLLGRTEYTQGLSLDGTMEAHGKQLSTRMNHKQGCRSFNNITILLMPCIYLYKFSLFLLILVGAHVGFHLQPTPMCLGLKDFVVCF
jgi:hypothetical protein